ncbi:MAG: aromatic ring-hydroxylating dioxygenase subunit alpha [Alphaproteobacteria bacterium]|nr:aromatic ring-hydroxylating dioxygenase subunit alpha [Alphaproteobacteria bacterium]
MIPDMWYPVLEARSLPAKRPVAVQRMGERLVMWRGPDGAPVCHLDRCPHRGVALSLGRIEKDGTLECPYHGFRFDSQGACTKIPCNGSKPVPRGFALQSWTVREAHGMIWLWWGQPRAQLPEPPWFDDIADDWTHTAEASEDWPLNHVRLTESFFDIHHFPFAHRSINPGLGPVLDPYEVEVIDDVHIVTRGTMRQEHKTSGVDFQLEMKFPNLIKLVFGSTIRAAVCATPIDDQRSWVWCRYHQDFLPVPGLGSFLAWLGVKVEFMIVQGRQDVPIMKSQTPTQPTPGCDHLVAADKGTATYLRLRNHHLRAREAS